MKAQEDIRQRLPKRYKLVGKIYFDDTIDCEGKIIWTKEFNKLEGDTISLLDLKQDLFLDIGYTLDTNELLNSLGEGKVKSNEHKTNYLKQLFPFLVNDFKEKREWDAEEERVFNLPDVKETRAQLSKIFKGGKNGKNNTIYQDKRY